MNSIKNSYTHHTQYQNNNLIETQNIDFYLLMKTFKGNKNIRFNVYLNFRNLKDH